MPAVLPPLKLSNQDAIELPKKMRRPCYKQRERRTKTHCGMLPFSDGLDQPCLVYQSALIGVK